MPEVSAALEPGRRVRVHVNLHQQRFAVVDPATTTVIAYVDDITLTAVRFRHQPACVRKVRERGVRAVCAYALGVIESLDTTSPVRGRRVAYNPFRRPDFHDPATGEHIADAARVRFVALRAYII